MMELIKSITKQEWKFWAKVLVGLLILTSVSRIFAIIFTPPGYVWSGRTYFYPMDRFVYVSYIEQMKNGAAILQDLYSAKGETMPMINLFWMGAGYLARLTNFSSMVALETSRIILIPGLLLVLYLFICYFFKDFLARKIAFLLATFGGGLGVWFYPISNQFMRGKEIIDRLPIDFSVAEPFIFSSAFYSVHFILSSTLLLLILLLTLLALDKKKLSYAAVAGAAGLLLVNFHPFSFFVPVYILFVYFIYLLWKDRGRAFFLFKYSIVFFLVSSPGIIYLLYMLRTPWWQSQAWDSGTEIPNFSLIIIGYGLLLFCSLAAIYKILKNELKIANAPFLIVWFFSQISLVFLPVSIQRRFLEGYAVALSILAASFILFLIKKRPWLTKGKIFPAASFIILFCLSFAVVIYLDFYNFYYKMKGMYLDKKNLAALREIKKYAGPDDMILADIYNSNLIPGLILRRVFIGHGVESINSAVKLNLLTRFGRSTSKDERKTILRNNKINYLFYDPSWNWAFNPDGDDFLKKIFDMDGYKLYKVL